MNVKQGNFYDFTIFRNKFELKWRAGKGCRVQKRVGLVADERSRRRGGRTQLTQGASRRPSGRGRMGAGHGVRKIFFRCGQISFPIGITEKSTEMAVYNRVTRMLEKEGVYCRTDALKFEDDCDDDELRVELELA